MTHCIDNRNMDVYFNLAAEEFLLKHKEGDYFMVWRNTPSVVVGRHQRLLAEVDTEYAWIQGISIARRYSGGGTVYHDAGNINLTFIETADSPDFSKYLHYTLGFLQSLGIPAEPDKRLSIYTNEELKVSGSAQSVHKNRVMYHCTLLFDTDLAMLNRVLTVLEGADKNTGKYTVPSVRSEVVNLASQLPQVPDAKEFGKMAYRYFLCHLPDNHSYAFTAEDQAAISLLRNEKYATEEWISEGVYRKII